MERLPKYGFLYYIFVVLSVKKDLEFLTTDRFFIIYDVLLFCCFFFKSSLARNLKSFIPLTCVLYCRWRYVQSAYSGHAPWSYRVSTLSCKQVIYIANRYEILSRRTRKPTICENKDADQLCINCTADQRLCFHYLNSTIPPLPISEISSFYPSPVTVQVGLCRTWSEFQIVCFLMQRLNLYYMYCPYTIYQKQTISKSPFSEDLQKYINLSVVLMHFKSLNLKRATNVLKIGSL